MIGVTDLRSEGKTDERTDGPTDGRKDRNLNQPSALHFPITSKFWND